MLGWLEEIEKGMCGWEVWSKCMGIIEMLWVVGDVVWVGHVVSQIQYWRWKNQEN